MVPTEVEDFFDFPPEDEKPTDEEPRDAEGIAEQGTAQNPGIVPTPEW
jgi:hypothetical protein